MDLTINHEQDRATHQTGIHQDQGPPNHLETMDQDHVTNSILIDPEVIGQMKREHPDIEQVLQEQQQNVAVVAAAVAAAREQDDKNQPRLLPRSDKGPDYRAFALDPNLSLRMQGSETGYINHQCTRCKKQFAEPEGGRVFKLCPHCRELQKERLRRWQMKTRKKQGACRRCGQAITGENQKYVLCPLCRMALRARKANRAAQGKCVHCSGPNDSPNGEFKVCQRCRDNDKMRRTKLEKAGACNRCAKPLLPEDVNTYKVCARCRNRKKRPNGEDDDKMAPVGQMGFLSPELQQQMQQMQRHDVSHSLLAENLVQQLSASTFANAALDTRNKEKVLKEEQNNLFLNPEGKN